MIARVFLNATVVLFLGGCASSVGVLKPISAIPSGYDVSYIDGTPVLTSIGHTSSIRLGPATPTIDRTQHVYFILLVANTGSNPLTLQPDSITVRTDRGKTLRVLTAMDLEAEARNKAWRIRLATALAVASNSMAAATAPVYSRSGYDLQAAAQARAEADAKNTHLMTEAGKRIEEIRGDRWTGAFESQTVWPGDARTTPLTLSRLPSRTKEIFFEVRLGGDTHTLRWIWAKR